MNKLFDRIKTKQTFSVQYHKLIPPKTRQLAVQMPPETALLGCRFYPSATLALYRFCLSVPDTGSKQITGNIHLDIVSDTPHRAPLSCFVILTPNKNNCSKVASFNN